MSVYRRTNAPRSDIHATPLYNEDRNDSGRREKSDWRYFAPDAESKIAEGVPAHVLAMRDPQQPANILLNHTVVWADKLPADVRPTMLMHEFPRVANMVALLWGEPMRTGFDEYMESLLVDRRGNRRGFPPDVAGDLLALRSAYDDHRRRR